MYGIYANIWGILMVNVTIYSIHGSYGYYHLNKNLVQDGLVYVLLELEEMVAEVMPQIMKNRYVKLGDERVIFCP